MQHNIFVNSFLQTVVLTLELAWFSKDFSKAWFVSCDAKSTSIFIHRSFALKADFSAAHAALFCFFVGRKQPNLTKILNSFKANRIRLFSKYYHDAYQ